MNPIPPKTPVTGRARDFAIAANRFALVFSRHWIFAFNIFLGLYIGLPMLAPVLMYLGLETPAKIIYTIYGGLCHQLGYRSWFLFGEQAAYPRDIFQSLTGINPDDLWAARGFLGTIEMGYKMALCQRDIAIYGAIILFGLVYSLPPVRARLKPLPWWAWVLIGIVPIGLDGLSQLLTQAPWHSLPLLNQLPSRESTPFLRTLTGALFGIANAWLAYPYVEESMRDAYQQLTQKLARVDAAAQAQS